MTLKDAMKEFQTALGNARIRSWRKTDKPALREAWNNYTDSLCKEGRISDRQYNTWLNPFLRE